MQSKYLSAFAALAFLAASAAIPRQSVRASTIQTQAPRDPTALALVNQALALLNGGTSLTDVTLDATVTYLPGPDQQTGTATLQAIGDSESLLVLTLSGGAQQEVRNGQQGAWVNADSSIFTEATHNCWVDSTWFFPGLVFTSVSANAQTALINLGETTWNGTSANEIQLYQFPPGHTPTMTAVIQSLSTEEVYLDPLTASPLAIDFNTHADSDATTNLPVEIQFSNYQTVNGMSVPFHVQKYVGGSLFLDVVVTSVTVNSGLSQSLFVIPQNGGI